MRELPPYGYYWAPAGMEQLYLSYLSKRPSEVYTPTHETKKVGKVLVHILEGFGTRLLSSRKLKFKHEPYAPGREVLKLTKFGLYNAQDQNLKSTHHMADELAKLCYRIQDSGGFQLFTGVKEFIDPVELVKYHDAFADSGVSLDLPSSLLHH